MLPPSPAQIASESCDVTPWLMEEHLLIKVGSSTWGDAGCPFFLSPSFNSQTFLGATVQTQSWVQLCLSCCDQWSFCYDGRFRFWCSFERIIDSGEHLFCFKKKFRVLIDLQFRVSSLGLELNKNACYYLLPKGKKYCICLHLCFGVYIYVGLLAKYLLNY